MNSSTGVAWVLEAGLRQRVEVSATQAQGVTSPIITPESLDKEAEKYGPVRPGLRRLRHKIDLVSQGLR